VLLELVADGIASGADAVKNKETLATNSLAA
jgi:hypothetical protein